MRALERKEELQGDGSIAAERILELMKDIPKDDLVNQAKKIRRELEETLRDGERNDKQQ